MMQKQLHRRRSNPVTIIDAIDDAHLFAPFFRNVESWQSWRVFLATLFGLSLTEEQRRLFHECTGRSEPSRDGYNEAWLVCGRRGGKSFVLSLVATYLATFKDWRPYLGPGEYATVPVIAADRRQ